jgi:uncharacterized protein (DUF2141 family)
VIRLKSEEMQIMGTKPKVSGYTLSMWIRPRHGFRPTLGALALVCSCHLGVADAALPGHASTGTDSLTLRVEIDGFRNDQGRAALGVFNTKAGFLKVAARVDGKLLQIHGGRTTAEFRGLGPGTYAVAILHDENTNNKLDYNLIGLPSEGYGFTNNAYSLFGPPNFEDAAMVLRSDQLARIHMRYFP